MSWRELLGVTPARGAPITHNTHKPRSSDNSAYCANSAGGDDSAKTSKLLEVLAEACKELPITPTEVAAALAPEDIADWEAGKLGVQKLTAFARVLMQRREMNQGNRPPHYNHRAICRQCGPIWCWFSGKVEGCPWCWNRLEGLPIPRPQAVQCEDCHFFQRTSHPALGHCARGEPEAPAGLWSTDPRYCLKYLPRQSDGDPSDTKRANSNSKLSK